MEVVSGIDGRKFCGATGHGDKVRMRGQVNFIAWKDKHRHGVPSGIGILGIDDPMGRRFEQSIGQILEHVSGINDDGILIAIDLKP